MRKERSKSDIWQNIEYYEKRFPNLTDEERREMLNNRKQEAKQKKKQNTNYREGNYQCIEYYEKRFPNLTDEERQDMMRKKIQDGIDIRPDDHGVNNPGHRSKTTELQRKQRSPMCLEFYINKYPNNSLEENKTLWNEFKSNHPNTYNDLNRWSYTSKNYYLLRGYSEEETLKMIEEASKTQFSLKRCIELHGEEEGSKLFMERQEKWISSINKTRNSRTSSVKYMTSMLEEDFVNILNDNFEEDCYMMDKQFTLRDEEMKKVYSYDFCRGNKIIEIHGEYWHADPRKFKKEYYFKKRNIYAIDIWERDERKKQIAIDSGYDVLIVWERDIRKNKQKEIDKCLKFLQSN